MGEDNKDEILESSEEKPHSILGIASCVTFLIGVGLYFLLNNILISGEYAINVIGNSNFVVVVGLILLIIRSLLGILSLRESNSKKIFGTIGLVADGLLLCLLCGFYFIITPAAG